MTSYKKEYYTLRMRIALTRLDESMGFVEGYKKKEILEYLAANPKQVMLFMNEINEITAELWDCFEKM